MKHCVGTCCPRINAIDNYLMKPSSCQYEVHKGLVEPGNEIAESHSINQNDSSSTNPCELHIDSYLVLSDSCQSHI